MTEPTDYKKELDRTLTLVAATCAVGAVLLASAIMDLLHRKDRPWKR